MFVFSFYPKQGDLKKKKKEKFTPGRHLSLASQVFFLSNLMESIDEIVSSIVPENGIENNHVIFRLQLGLSEKVYENYYVQ